MDICLIYSSILLATMFAESSINVSKLAVFLVGFPPLFGIAILIFYLTGLYSNQRNQDMRFIVINVGIGVVIQSVVTVFILRWNEALRLSLITLLISICIQVLLISITHFIFRHLKQREQRNKRVLIIEGETSFAQAFIEKSYAQSKWYKNVRVLRQPDKDMLITALLNADLIVFGDRIHEKESLVRICLYYGKEILMQPDIYDLFIVHSQIAHMDDMLTLSVHPHKLTMTQRMCKRALDVVGSILIFIILAPLLLILFVIIPLTSQGAAIYKQERAGMGCRRFQVYKFRSMISDAEQRTGPVLAVENDPRITRVGRWMRSVRFDELPQLLNVLKGEMSLVGPRPERPFFTEQFTNENPDYMYRFAVKPGITGLAQVMGKYSSTPEQKLRFDILYVQNYSLWLDVKIAFRTIYTVLQKEQSVGIKQSLMEGHLNKEIGV
nr:sugar transferase [Paenibacillus sp. yr247]